MESYPICLVGMERRRTVVVGGGHVAVRKVEGLLEAGADVTVISPAFRPELIALSEAGRVTIVSRSYCVGDLAGAFLVFAATGDAQVNQAVWQEAERCGCLVNVVDDPAHCNFIMPAVVRRGDVTVAVSTGGASPALARRLRERLEILVGPEYGEFASLLSEFRSELQARYTNEKSRREKALRLVDSDLMDIMIEKGLDEARRHARALLLAGNGEPDA